MSVIQIEMLEIVLLLFWTLFIAILMFWCGYSSGKSNRYSDGGYVPKDLIARKERLDNEIHSIRQSHNEKRRGKNTKRK